MLFEIEVNGRTRKVTVEHVGAPSRGYRVTIDGEPHDVDAAALDAGRWSLVLPDQGGRVVAAGVAEHRAGAMTVYLGRVAVAVTVDGARRRRVTDAQRETGEIRVVSPMPGKVLRVLVTPGQDVSARQPLVVVEAMKMENELSSPRAGRVKEVAVAEGISVEAGRLLAIVE